MTAKELKDWVRRVSTRYPNWYDAMRVVSIKDGSVTNIAEGEQVPLNDDSVIALIVLEKMQVPPPE